MTRVLTDAEKHELQDDLVLLFQEYGLSVAIGLTRTGIAIRSQDELVDARNIGELRALPNEHSESHEPGSHSAS